MHSQPNICKQWTEVEWRSQIQNISGLSHELITHKLLHCTSWVLVYTFWNLSQNWHEYNKCLYVILFLKNRSIVSTPCNTCLHELDISYQPSINIYGSCMMHSTSQVRFAGRRSPIAFWASKTSSRLLVCCSCPFSLSLPANLHSSSRPLITNYLWPSLHWAVQRRNLP